MKGWDEMGRAGGEAGMRWKGLRWTGMDWDERGWDEMGKARMRWEKARMRWERLG